jgi:hypothetical protein
MQESQLMYLLMTLTMGHPANVPPPAKEVLVATQNQTESQHPVKPRCESLQQSKTLRCGVKPPQDRR